MRSFSLIIGGASGSAPDDRGPARDRGRAARAGLVTLVLISKYRDHLPLERQAKIYQRFGVDLSPKTIVGWVEAGAWRPKSSRIYGGVFRVLIVDNMRAIVAVADPLEARIVPAFRESSTWVKCSRGIRPVVL